MQDLSIPKQIADLRDISENVADYLDREIYDEYFGPGTDYTVEDILQECYAIVLQELTEYGITFSCEEEDLLQDWYVAHKLYELRYVLDAINFKDHLLRYTEDIEGICNLLDTEESDDIFPALIAYLVEHHPDDVRFKDIDYLTQDIVASSRLRDHIAAILENLEEVGAAVVIPDMARAKRYIAKTQELRALAREAVEKITTQLYTVDWNRPILEKLLADYDLDKIAPDTLKIFSVIDLEPEVSPMLANYRTKMLDEHHKRSLHHIEYWIDEDKDPRPIPTKENLALLVAHHNEPGTTTETFWQEIREMLEKGSKIFTAEDKQLILQMAECVFPRDGDE